MNPRLPPLREDLQLHPGPRNHAGAPTWTLHDPLTHRYYRIGASEFEILSNWGAGAADAVAAAVRNRSLHTPDAEDVVAFAQFLDQHDLLRYPGHARAAEWVARKARRHGNRWWWLLKNYLFLKWPLINPDRFLARTVGWVGFAFRPAFLITVAVGAVVGALLVLRDANGFLTGLQGLADPGGLVALGVALMLSKSLHELGHGYAARYHGCRVPAMGVALLVLWPVLWTDTTEAWRLRERSGRLAIGAAGIVVELTLAAIASIAWAVLPDGGLRDAMLVLAGVTWLTTLAINLNPFIRFDGYYLLADWLDVANLQDRAFALGRWRLRRALFGWDDPPPEYFPAPRRRFLVLFAWATWAYRLALFLAIAALVYHFAFKLLGLFLAAVEIAWFILRPLGSELLVWWSRRRHMKPNLALLRSGLILAGVALLLAWPWQQRLAVPALLQASAETVLYAPEAGQIRIAPDADATRFAAQETVFALAVPGLEHARTALEARITEAEARIQAQSVNQQLAEGLAGSLQQRARLEAERGGLDARERALNMRAPADADLRDRPPGLDPGGWVAAGEFMGRLVHHGPARIIAIAPEQALMRLDPEGQALFLPSRDPARSFAARVSRVDTAALESLPYAEFAADHGGPIAVRREPSSGLAVPVTASYRIELALEERLDTPERTVLGSVLLPVMPRSLIARTADWLLAVWVRESGW